MTTISLSQSDLRIRDSVSNELVWDSRLDASAIGVTARDGAVTLTGFIDSYAGKLAAERAAKRVRGVRAVANDVQVRLRLDRTDADIARDASRTLELHSALPEDVQATVREGHVTLTGRVDSLFKRTVAENAIGHVKGVKHVVNRIEVVPGVAPKDVQREISRALHRNAEIEARSINVSVFGNRVQLSGTVDSWREREAAERAAAHASGIAIVNNNLGVRMETPSTDDEIC